MRILISLVLLVIFLFVFTRGLIFSPQAYGAFLPLVAIALVFLAVSVVVGKVHQRSEARRDRDYANFCAARGFFYLDAPAGDETGFDAFWLFQRGRNRTIRHEISGTHAGYRFSAFEYSYITGGGRNTRRHVAAVLAWDTDTIRLPEFTLRREYLYDSLGQLLGGHDIDFVEDPAFSDAYVLQGPNEAATRDLFTTEVRATFSANPGQNAAAWLDRLIWWLESSLPPPASLDLFISDGDRVRDALISQRHADQ
jgi:hypothetical protein